jgi:carbamoyl-phosphate synthase large subunit
MKSGKLTILLSSAGRRVGLISCFRRAGAELGLDFTVLACDVEPTMSAACQLADRSFKVPRCDDPSFIDVLCDIVRENGVSLIIPTIDPELLPLAKSSHRFAACGARVHVSSPDVIEVARDKLETIRVLGRSGVPVPRTLDFLEVQANPCNWSWPMFMKPKAGSASRGLTIIHAPTDLPDAIEEPMILQELLRGPEFTINMFIDIGGALRSVVTHRRLRIRAGEVEKGRTERHPELQAMAQTIARALPAARGVLCFQAIADPERGTKVFEINARFGGGYPLVDRAGATFARWLLEEVVGLTSTAHDSWLEGLVMLRYDAELFTT